MKKSHLTNVSKVVLIAFLLQFLTPILAETIVLRNGTPLQLSLFQTINSGTATVGQRVTFKLSYDLKVKGKILIPAGANAMGEVVDVESKGMIGKPGTLSIQIKSIRAIDGTIIPLSASKVVKGKDKQTTAIIVTLLLCIFGLMMQGEDASLQQGTIIEAYTIGDIDIEIE